MSRSRTWPICNGLVLDGFTPRREVARVETRLIFQQWDCGPLLPPDTDRNAP
jgi:hypothetical protein